MKKNQPVNVHRLKTTSKFFNDVISGKKTFDVRKNDRGFQVNDIIILLELGYSKDAYEKEKPELQVPSCVCLITYVLTGGQFGIDSGYCVLGIKIL